MSAAAELALRWHICDPRPDHCAGCFRGAEAGVEFYTCDSAIDRGMIVQEVDGAVLHRESIDDLNLCAVRNDRGQLTGGCVRELLESVAYKPELHSRQLREIRRLELENEHLRDALGRARRDRDDLADSKIGPSAPVRRRAV